MSLLDDDALDEALSSLLEEAAKPPLVTMSDKRARVHLQLGPDGLLAPQLLESRQAVMDMFAASRRSVTYWRQDAKWWPGSRAPKKFQVCAHKLDAALRSHKLKTAAERHAGGASKVGKLALLTLQAQQKRTASSTSVGSSDARSRHALNPKILSDMKDDDRRDCARAPASTRAPAARRACARPSSAPRYA